MPRWSRIFRRRSTQSENNNDDDPAECHACTRIGIPVFHSTSCDPSHQPEWEALAGSSLLPIKNRSSRKSQADRTAGDRQPAGPSDVVFDPRSEIVQKWNRAVLMARGVALAVDPVFFFSLAVSRGGRPAVYVDGGVAAVAAVVRTCVDAVHLCHLLVQFRLAYVSRESLAVGCGKLVWDPRAIASHYLRSSKAFWFDAFVIVPVPQVLYWLVAPKLIREERIEVVMTTLELIFLFQFIPKVYHSFFLMQRMRKVTGYVFGTIWWGFALNLIAYFLASHAAGGCWYILSIQRIASCLSQQNYISTGNYQTFEIQRNRNSSFPKMARKELCFDVNGAFPYGIYQFALPLISTNSTAIKILYSNLWGLMALSTMGNNLEPTSKCSEVLFCICVVLGGLMLFTLLIGNIQVFLHAVTARRRKMQVRYQDMQWWMRRRQLPVPLRKRVGHFERQRWATMGGVEDEMELIKDLPEGLRRDIKRHLCLDLIKKIMREGDPVQKMIFIVHGRIKRSQTLSKGTLAATTLQPGTILGDELLSWCLRRPFIDRLPASNATFKCLQPAEAFILEFDDLRYITDHFRYRFANEKVKRTARYYSSNWRNWAAVNIQFAWRRYRTGIIRVPVSSETENGGGEIRLRRYAAVFMSLRPHDHLE
ncbi:cyclic nucleotide-gated ion channel 2-like isoform X2 [Rhododendron vialii]|uniref:cyclic nucleotide-gated ion channel 2-like isoform X2 n=1 Tax=Rhododendron vialii TaxID=182163 RepID=UPI00265F84A0|nr:cyclic nucleotide-gated ion channel 2-like isoform X2 [Rhododendron vialii]